MAKGTKAGAILVKLVSTAATGYFYVKVSERGRIGAGRGREAIAARVAFKKYLAPPQIETSLTRIILLACPYR